MRNTAGLKLLALYFVIGGLIIATVTCFGIQGKSEFAVLIAFLPGTTLITLITIYLAGGVGAAGSYAKSMLILLPAWVLYVLVVIFPLPRLDLALLVSVAPYLGAASLTMKPT